MHKVLSAYGIEPASARSEAIGHGLIHHTWKITVPGHEYILQQVNHEVFKEPEIIADNIGAIADYLSVHHPDYLFVGPLPDQSGNTLVYQEGEGYFRLFPFIKNSVSVNLAETPEQAYQAAMQFGRFTRLLSGFDTRQLKSTIPFFHDLTLRYRQFLTALECGNKDRISTAASLIQFLNEQAGIVTEFAAIQSNPAYRQRVTHHDTKISNVLFDKEGRGICVIDLDTVMPGYFISDVGDMLRTCLCPVTEEEKDFSKIVVRDEFYTAIIRGYYQELEAELTLEEKASFFYAGKYMTYMQALRFLTDYLNDDIYYGSQYPDQNLVRAGNQAMLLQRLEEKEPVWQHLL